MQQQILDVLRTVAERYPVDMVAGQLGDLPRIAYNIELVLAAAAPTRLPEVELCDLGGGIGVFTAVCGALGFKRTVLVDDFNDEVNQQRGDTVLDIHRSSGVDVESRDVLARGITDLAGSFDVITSFDSMEHWHHSPKRLFQEVLAKLKPGGAFILGVPNCVNLRKRITVPLGLGKWSAMQDWYEAQHFRGHVREPDVDDLRYIARSLGLEETRIYGRNWAGYHAGRAVVRLATRLVDYPLRLRPSLCSDLYMVGKKPRAVRSAT